MVFTSQGIETSYKIVPSSVPLSVSCHTEEYSLLLAAGGTVSAVAPEKLHGWTFCII